MITIYADKYLYKLHTFLPGNVDLNLYDPEYGLPEHMDGIDALLVRTVTAINKKNLSQIPDTLQFVGTGSAGSDHIDTRLLRNKGITFASAAGCNARSVAEYVVTALLIWAEEKSVTLSDRTIGIIGVGHTGSALQTLLEQLSVPVVAYDPPRALREENFTSAELEEVLSADILTFHTPLTFTGAHPTHYWLDSEKLSAGPFDLIINTSRGGVVNERALLTAHTTGMVRDMIIDVWEGEPVFDDDLARKALIKTPHIAGYSIQAKLNASKLIADKLTEYFGLSSVQPSEVNPSRKPSGFFDSSSGISDILTSIHPILRYQEELVQLIGIDPAQKGLLFNKVRAEYPLRMEFPALDVPAAVTDQYPILRTLFK